MNKIGLAERKDFLTGLFFVAVAVLFGIAASALHMGRFGRMGPGYFPIILVGLLAFLGLLLMLRTFFARNASTDDASGGDDGADTVAIRLPVRALVFVLGGALAFALTVRPLGFLPATVIALLLSIGASNRHGVVSAMVLTAVLTAGAWAIFVVGLGLPWPLIGRWY